MKKILLIDDSDTYTWCLKIYLQHRGYPVKTACTLKEARAAIQEEMPLVVCCDLDLPDGSGMDFLDEVRAADKELPFILASCHDKDDYEQEAKRRGATLCMDKMKGLLLQDKLVEFPIVKDTTPNMMNPRLYTTSYNKPQGQQFDDTAVLSFIKLQYT